MDKILDNFSTWFEGKSDWTVVLTTVLPLIPLIIAANYLPKSGIIIILLVIMFWVMVCFACAGGAWLRIAKREFIIRQTDSIRQIRVLDFRDFEVLVAAIFEREGYLVEERGGPRPDGGIDMIIWKERRKSIVQCKHIYSESVGVNIVRELFGVVTAEKAERGILVTSGRFSEDALAFAVGKPIELLDAHQLYEKIKALQGADDAEEKPKDPIQEFTKQIIERMSDAGACIIRPKCLKCGKPMRLVHHPKKRGEWFWGCIDFPTCRSSRRINEADRDALPISSKPN